VKRIFRTMRERNLSGDFGPWTLDIGLSPGGALQGGTSRDVVPEQCLQGFDGGPGRAKVVPEFMIHELASDLLLSSGEAQAGPFS